MDIVTSQLLRRAVPLFTAMATAVLLLAITSILYFGQTIFVPFALGILLSFILAPIVNVLQRWNVPRMLAISGAILAATAIIVVIVGIVVSQIASLAVELPNYRQTIQTKIESFAAESDTPSGPLARAREALSGMITDLQNIGETTQETGQRDTGTPPAISTPLRACPRDIGDLAVARAPRHARRRDRVRDLHPPPTRGSAEPLHPTGRNGRSAEDHRSDR